MASCLEYSAPTPVLALLPVFCLAVLNLITIPDLCQHWHLLGTPCMIPWVGPLGAMLVLVRHLRMGMNPRTAERTRAVTAIKSTLLPALF